MKATAITQQPENRHPWADLEPAFQCLRDQETGYETARKKYLAAVDRVCCRCQKSACALMRRWDLRNSEDLGHDVAQEWFIQLSGILTRCDGRPVHCVAYAAMKYLCMAASRSARRHVGLPDGFDVSDEQATALDRLVAREEQELLDTSIAKLPPKMRDAIKYNRSRFRNETTKRKVPAKQQTEAEQKATLARYRNAYRARQLLMKWLTRYYRLDA